MSITSIKNLRTIVQRFATGNVRGKFHARSPGEEIGGLVRVSNVADIRSRSIVPARFGSQRPMGDFQASES
jgi:hypothetical protein